MKKLTSLLMVFVLALGLFSVAMAEDDLGLGTAKIAILTGTTTQGEEEFRAAQTLAAKYPNNVVTATYPDAFSSEIETTIGTMMEFATDPDVKAIIFVQSVAGASAGFQQIKEMRDDILLIAGVMGENPDVIGAAADIVLNADEINQGHQIVQTLKDWDVDTLVHYSFTRHMSYDTIVARYNLLKANCEAAGIELVSRDAPDPTGEAGTTGAQQFILEDVPLYMAENPGKNIAFFSTNCSMQEALQKAVLDEENAYYPLPCCPSPYHGFPASMGIEVAEDEWGDYNLFLNKIGATLATKNGLSRFSTWPVALNMGMINASFDYATKWIKGDFAEKLNKDELVKSLSGAAGGYEVQLSNWVIPATDGVEESVLENVFMIMVDRVDFNDFQGT